MARRLEASPRRVLEDLHRAAFDGSRWDLPPRVLTVAALRRRCFVAFALQHPHLEGARWAAWCKSALLELAAGRSLGRKDVDPDPEDALPLAERSAPALLRLARDRGWQAPLATPKPDLLAFLTGSPPPAWASWDRHEALRVLRDWVLRNPDGPFEALQAAWPGWPWTRGQWRTARWRLKLEGRRVMARRRGRTKGVPHKRRSELKWRPAVEMAEDPFRAVRLP